MLEQSEEKVKKILTEFKPEFNATDWDAMEALLDKKEKRKIFPFWLLAAPIAAALCLGFTFTYHLYSTQFHNINQRASLHRNSHSLKNAYLPIKHSSKKNTPIKSSTVSNQYAYQKKNHPLANPIITPTHRKEETLIISKLYSTPISTNEERKFSAKKMEEEKMLFDGLISASRKSKVSFNIDHGFLFSTQSQSRTLSFNALALSDFVLSPSIKVHPLIHVFAGLGISNRPINLPDSSGLEGLLGSVENHNVVCATRTGFQIPIGLAFTIIDKHNIRFYAKTAVINQIPIQEKYVYTKENLPESTALNIGNLTVQPTASSFASDNISSNGNSDNAYKVLKKSATSNYRAELLISSGIDIRAGKRISVHFEPGYLLQLNELNRNDLSAHQFNFKTGVSIHL